jgi:hypothetical protein
VAHPGIPIRVVVEAWADLLLRMRSSEVEIEATVGARFVAVSRALG